MTDLYNSTIAHVPSDYIVGVNFPVPKLGPFSVQSTEGTTMPAMIVDRPFAVARPPIHDVGLQISCAPVAPFDWRSYIRKVFMQEPTAKDAHRLLVLFINEFVNHRLLTTNDVMTLIAEVSPNFPRLRNNNTLYTEPRFSTDQLLTWFDMLATAFIEVRLSEDFIRQTISSSQLHTLLQLGAEG